MNHKSLADRLLGEAYEPFISDGGISRPLIDAGFHVLAIDHKLTPKHPSLSGEVRGLKATRGNLTYKIYQSEQFENSWIVRIDIGNRKSGQELGRGLTDSEVAQVIIKDADQRDGASSDSATYSNSTDLSSLNRYDELSDQELQKLGFKPVKAWIDGSGQKVVVANGGILTSHNLGW